MVLNIEVIGKWLWQRLPTPQPTKFPDKRLPCGEQCSMPLFMLESSYFYKKT